MKFAYHGVVAVFLGGSLAWAAGTSESTPEEAEPFTFDDYYDAGKALFDQFAPPEVKENYVFPSREEWTHFATRLQGALEGNSLEDLAEYEPEARAALEALQSFPGTEDYTEWLEERLDYIEAAKRASVEEKAVAQPKLEVVKTDIPHLELWRGRLASRRVPKRASEFIPELEGIFNEAGMPPELAWLAEVESSFNPEARSPVGARGLFQFMPATAKDMGLSTEKPDERVDPEKAAKAAARYLHFLHVRFNDWPLTLAAYNAGLGRVRRTLKKHDAKTFGEISAHLPAETRMYVPKVLATIERRAAMRWDEMAGPKS